jgi:hypothetical protein
MYGQNQRTTRAQACAQAGHDEAAAQSQRGGRADGAALSPVRAGLGLGCEDIPTRLSVMRVVWTCVVAFIEIVMTRAWCACVGHLDARTIDRSVAGVARPHLYCERCQRETTGWSLTR